MSTAKSEAERIRLTRVDEVSGADPGVRSEVSQTTDDVETASAALRSALGQLHHSQDDAWRQYASDLEAASLRFDTTLAVAAARLRAERAASRDDLGEALDEVATAWRTRADEIRVQTRLGEMDARDAGLHLVEGLDQATHRISAIVASLTHDTKASLDTLKASAGHAFDELGHALQELRPVSRHRG